MPAVAAVALATSVLASTPAGASDRPTASAVSCGQTITHSTVLKRDVGPCPAGGVVVGADNIVLDLHGHRIFGAPSPSSPSGHGAGVYLLDRTGVTVTGGTVSNFDGGVVIEGGSSNNVVGVTARDNLGGNGTNYGDGILIESSTGNRIADDAAVHNGPFSGIGIVSLVDSDHPRATTGTSSGNQILFNTVADNNVGRNSVLDDNDGIRIEPDSTGNVVVGNHVSGSGLDGISLFKGSGDTVVSANVSTANGFDNQVGRHGDGIIVFNLADGNTVVANRVTGNAANGIQIRGPVGATAGSTDNTIAFNAALGNSQLPVIPSPVFGATYDLKDANPNCDSNRWLANRSGTAFPACTTTGLFGL
ncbi:MAG: NosD domain-containing protein [Acidimicrobiales bacterium]